MRTLLFVLFTVLFVLFGRSQIKPVLLNGNSALFSKGGFLEFQIGGGIRFDDHLFLAFNFRHSKGLVNPMYEAMKHGTLSISSGYRLFGDNRISSPLLLIDLGAPIISNANGVLTKDGVSIGEEYYTGYWRYNRGLFFGKFKLMSDLKVKSFNILLGVSYNLWYESTSTLGGSDGSSGYNYYYVKETSIEGTHNFGLEMGIMYTFQGKKDKQE